MKMANSASCLYLAFCASLFYVLMYGDGRTVVYRWPMLQHWGLKLGLCLIISGAIFHALSWKYVGWSGALLNMGLALVFNWAYVYHKNLFRAERK